jgi:hypothetical protein
LLRFHDSIFIPVILGGPETGCNHPFIYALPK